MVTGVVRVSVIMILTTDNNLDINENKIDNSEIVLDESEIELDDIPQPAQNAIIPKDSLEKTEQVN